MARRINTGFVITLVVSLTVAAGGGAYYVGMRMLRNRDPVYLKAQGDEAIARGDILHAASFYSRAANAAAAVHREDTDALFSKLGDLCMQASQSAASSE